MTEANRTPQASRRGHYGRYHLALFALLLAVWVWAAIDPLFPDDWLLENMLVFIAVPFVVGLSFYFRLSKLSYALVTLFLALHVVGSHYTYAEVPFGFTLQRWLDADRNMYDRLIHFAFGLLIAYPVHEIFVRITRARGVWALYLPVELCLAFSALYEVIEWATASVVDPGAGLAFLGTQGDVWDAEKDMALGALGAIVAMTATLLVRLRLDPRTKSELRDSLRIPADDKPLGEVKIAALLRRKRSKPAKSRRERRPG